MEIAFSFIQGGLAYLYVASFLAIFILTPAMIKMLRRSQDSKPKVPVESAQLSAAKSDVNEPGARRETFKRIEATLHRKFDPEVIETPNSSWIESLTFFKGARQTLLINLRSECDAGYVYTMIPIKVWEAFKYAESKGDFYNEHLKGVFRGKHYDAISENHQLKIEGKHESLQVVSWNLYNFGKSKNDEEMAYIAHTVVDFDIVAIQEISKSLAGVRAVQRLVLALEQMESGWEYAISPPTTGDGSERYAYVWKRNRVDLKDDPWLSEVLAEGVDREPFMGRFITPSGAELLLANFHAVPAGKLPQKEVAQLAVVNERHSDENLVFLGDFNLGQASPAFDVLKQRGFVPTLRGQKTSLKRERKGVDYLTEPYDNILYHGERLVSESAGYIDFVEDFSSLKDARQISDHLPVWISVNWG